jgi:hypothetical protein
VVDQRLQLPFEMNLGTNFARRSDRRAQGWGYVLATDSAVPHKVARISSTSRL